jgi:hypothetical protein
MYPGNEQVETAFKMNSPKPEPLIFPNGVRFPRESDARRTSGGWPGVLYPVQDAFKTLPQPVSGNDS